MKKILLLLLFSLLAAHLFSQDKSDTGNGESSLIVHYKKDASLSLSPNMLFNTPNVRMFAGGLKVRMFMGKNFSFDSDLMIGKDFIQLGPGLLGLSVLLLGFDWEIGTGEDQNGLSEIILMGIAVLFSAEHFSFHFPVAKNTEISPYISLLRFRQFNSKTLEENGKPAPGALCFAGGLEINRYFNRFLLSPYIDYTAGYSQPIKGFTGGIHFGYYFTGR